MMICVISLKHQQKQNTVKFKYFHLKKQLQTYNKQNKSKDK